MLNSYLIFGAVGAGGIPATWDSEAIDTHDVGTTNIAIQILWKDVAVTFSIWRTNLNYPVASAIFSENITVSYRVGDPLWVDPAIGNPPSQHIVSINNLGARYFHIHFTGGAAGAVPYIYIVASLDRKYR
jgi:hypothetical protein